MSSTTGRIPVHQTTRAVQTEPGRAAYTSSDLQPRVSSTGRYAMPERRYVYGASRFDMRPGFQKPVTQEGTRAEVEA